MNMTNAYPNMQPIAHCTLHNPLQSVQMVWNISIADQPCTGASHSQPDFTIILSLCI